MPEVREKTLNVYEYILSEENAWRTTRVPLASNWRDWNMYEHIDRSFSLKNSKFYLGQQDYTRPFNNIILPIANVNYRTEGFDVKDAQIYVDDEKDYHKSFVARKMHNWWAKENHIDTAIDESVESYFDYGLVLLKNVNEVKPEVVQLQQLAFCDQTDIMSGPICLKHSYSISELLEFKGKWDSEAIDNAILMAETSKDVDSADGDEAETPGKYIEVYELHGTFPNSWLVSGEEETGQYKKQVHIVTYYVSPDTKQKTGITLFKSKETREVFKALKRDPIYGRACGRGGIEELFHPQIWTNYSELHISQMLEAVSKVILKTNKKKITSLNNFSNMKHGQILDLDDDGRLEQLIVQPINKREFDLNINKWEQVARTIGSASDPALGKNPTSGTPLGTTELVTSQGQGIHEYRQGKIAEFWQEIYRDWVLEHFRREISKGKKWLDDISDDDAQEIVDKVARSRATKKMVDMIIKGENFTAEEKEMFIQLEKETFLGSRKQFLEAIKDEFKDLSMDVEISIAGKKANLAEMVSKLNSVFRTLFTPGAVQAIKGDPELAKLLNEILETSGLSPMKLTGGVQQPQQTQLPQGQVEAPITAQ